MATNQGCKGLVPNKSLHYKFLYHYLSSIVDLLNELGTGATFKELSGGKLKEIPIPIPPLDEQRRIVALLDEAFDAIATARAHAEKNRQNARALFDSYLNAVFSQKGEGWNVVQIGDIAEVYDGPHATPKTVESGPVFLGISALQDGKIKLDKTRHVTAEDFVRWTRRVKPVANDVVFSYETRLGQAAIVPEGLECCLGRRMGLIRPNTDLVDPQFFVHQYVSPVFRNYLESKTIKGATVDRISIKFFPTFTIALPTLPVQRQISDKIRGINEEVDLLARVYERKLSALEELKKSLLDRAFRGEL
jgi:type I restriction enzyme S subunit